MTDSTAASTNKARSEVPQSEPKLAALRNAVAHSAIRIELAAPAAPLIADWARLRHSDAADGAILAWIASHVPGADRRRVH
jgi:hypothetical protein